MATTTTTHRPFTIARLDRARWDMDGDIAEGRSLGDAAIGFTAAQFETLEPDDGHPGIIAWERVVDEAIEEIGPQVRDLLYDALHKRLPWTWSPSDDAAT